jgi:hypothetical protein
MLEAGVIRGRALVVLDTGWSLGDLLGVFGIRRRGDGCGGLLAHRRHLTVLDPPDRRWFSCLCHVCSFDRDRSPSAVIDWKA